MCSLPHVHRVRAAAHLKSLDMSNCNLSSHAGGLPQGIRRLSNLTALNLCNTRLRSAGADCRPRASRLLPSACLCYLWSAHPFCVSPPVSPCFMPAPADPLLPNSCGLCCCLSRTRATLLSTPAPPCSSLPDGPYLRRVETLLLGGNEFGRVPFMLSKATALQVCWNGLVLVWYCGCQLVLWSAAMHRTAAAATSAH